MHKCPFHVAQIGISKIIVYAFCKGISVLKEKDKINLQTAINQLYEFILDSSSQVQVQVSFNHNRVEVIRVVLEFVHFFPRQYYCQNNS